MDLLKELQGSKNIVISGHVRPDGDCIGSVMGTYLYLKKAMPYATIIPMIEQPAKEFEIIKDIADIKSDFKADIEEVDSFVGLDCSTLDRFGDAVAYYEKAKKTIIIDHHISNDGFGDVSLVDGGCSSASELVFSCMDESFIDTEIAKALYIGIIHDTGVMQYSNTKPETLMAVAKLISFGFDFPAIITETFYEKTKLQNDMLGIGITNSKMVLDGKVMTSVIDKSTMDKMGANAHDLDGIINQLLNTKGVEAAVLMHELEEGMFKISMRSKGKVDVAKIAKEFDGGGHVRAAGFSLNGTSDEILDKVMKAIGSQI